MSNKEMVEEVVRYMLDNPHEPGHDEGDSFNDRTVQYMVKSSHGVSLDTAFIDEVIQTMEGIETIRIYRPKKKS